MKLFQKSKEKAEVPEEKQEEINVESYLEKGYLHVRVIVEVLGKPKEHVEHTVETLRESVDRERSHVIVKLEKQPITEQGELFSTYMDLELLSKDIDSLHQFCFKYLPSSVEVLAPSQFHYQSSDLSLHFNELVGHIHQLDMIVKNLRAENDILKKNGGALLNNIILLVLREGPKNIEDLSKNVGISTKELEAILEKMENQERILKDGELYKRKE